MTESCVGIMSAGEMGAAVARALTIAGRRVLTVTRDRSPRTVERARSAGAERVESLDELVAEAGVVVSIVPPGAASDVAGQLAAGIRSVGSSPIVVDANAVSPMTAEAIARTLQAAGARFVDGDVIGGPPASGKRATRLYLSGDDAEHVASIMSCPELRAVALSGPAMGASSLKMAYAAWSKGSAALALTAWALARSLGVERALLAEWEESQPQLRQLCENAARGAGRAWRFVAEMDQIGSTLDSVHLPTGAAEGAVGVYQRLAPLKGEHGPTIATVLDLLVSSTQDADRPFNEMTDDARSGPGATRRG
jgi:3-hydroxyisobutyrate dehydrogenase-like beta-hydroxyacid dehydrogenase